MNAIITTNVLSVNRLVLGNFRNYEHLSLNLQPCPVVITGSNGSGKTNILEALSLFAPGKGLRGVKLSEADRITTSGTYPWAISAAINSSGLITNIGTGRDPTTPENKRLVKIDGEKIKSQAELAMVFSVMWLTPMMDGIFIGASVDRRKFLDRLVYNFDPEHASRVYSYEYCMRERAKLLQSGGDKHWLSVLESKMSEKSVAIAAARIETIQIIQSSINQSKTDFPKANIGVEGRVEQLLEANKTALQTEEDLRKIFFDSRYKDQESGRTNIGVHRSDFTVFHASKNMPAAACSTGEQKALLLSIILAEAKAKAQWKSSVPVLLLDEVIAHLDELRRHSLFDEFLQLGAQVWMSGTDANNFEYLKDKAQFFVVRDGCII